MCISEVRARLDAPAVSRSSVVSGRMCGLALARGGAPGAGSAPRVARGVAVLLAVSAPLVEVTFRIGSSMNRHEPPFFIGRIAGSLQSWLRILAGRTPSFAQVAGRERSYTVRYDERGAPTVGMIRKTLSVGTLGMVSFRSTKEQLRRAERARWSAERDLEREHDARLAAETRVSKAERRLQHAADAARQATERLEQSRSKRRRHRSERVRKWAESAEPAGRHAKAVARKSAREARRARSARYAKRSTWRRRRRTRSATSRREWPVSTRDAAGNPSLHRIWR